MNRFFQRLFSRPVARQKRTQPRRSALRVESLERRELMAGDVAAYLQNGDLILNEAAGHAGAAQSVQVSQLVNGKIRIQGTSGDGGPSSLINGQAFQDFTVTGNLKVNFGGGDDLVVFSSTATPHFKDVNINTAAPIGFAGSDIDSVILWSAETTGSMNINTGAGADWVFLSEAVIGDGVGLDNLTINTGADQDQVDVKHSQIKHDVSIITYDNAAEKDLDWVTVDNAGIGDTLAVQLGDGDDHAYIGHLSAKSIGLYGRGGNDEIKADHIYGVDNFFAGLGEGDDTLEIDTLFAKHGTASGGAGFDRVTIKDSDAALNFVDWEMINGSLNLPFPKPFPGQIQPADFQVAPRS